MLQNLQWLHRGPFILLFQLFYFYARIPGTVIKTKLPIAILGLAIVKQFPKPICTVSAR